MKYNKRLKQPSTFQQRFMPTSLIPRTCPELDPSQLVGFLPASSCGELTYIPKDFPSQEIDETGSSPLSLSTSKSGYKDEKVASSCAHWLVDTGSSFGPYSWGCFPDGPGHVLSEQRERYTSISIFCSFDTLLIRLDEFKAFGIIWQWGDLFTWN